MFFIFSEIVPQEASLFVVLLHQSHAILNLTLFTVQILWLKGGYLNEQSEDAKKICSGDKSHKRNWEKGTFDSGGIVRCVL